VAEQKLDELGLRTLGEVAVAPLPALRGIFGAWAERVKANAAGRGSGDLGRDRPAFREHDPEGELIGSISNERTFREDVSDPEILESMLCSLCERVCWRARKRGVEARTVTLKLRYANFHTISRSKTFPPTCSELELYPILQDLYAASRNRSMRVRLIGVALSNLGLFGDQMDLFAGNERLHRAVDAIRERFGFDAVRLAQSRRRP
jgi:DNA polymerase-4